MKSSSNITALVVLSTLTQCQPVSHPSQWSDQKVNEWFESRQYLSGLQILPYPSIDRRAFAGHYFDHQESWDKAFAFLKNTDLTQAALGKIELGDRLFAVVSEYSPSDREGASFEAHQKYIDIQYVISGNECMDVAPLEKITVTKPYNPENDASFGAISEFTELKASPDRFFIFFPDEAHRPGIKSGNGSVPVRKVVVKVPVDNDHQK
jgi:YhcH/YjgK/YiaL family protein